MDIITFNLDRFNGCSLCPSCKHCFLHARCTSMIIANVLQYVRFVHVWHISKRKIIFRYIWSIKSGEQFTYIVQLQFRDNENFVWIHNKPYGLYIERMYSYILNHRSGNVNWRKI